MLENHKIIDEKHNFFANEKQVLQVSVPVEYVGYHREGYHLVRPIPNKDTMGLRDQDLLIHESLLNKGA